MPFNENDLSYIIDIVDCIMDINEFTKSISYNEFEKDKMRKFVFSLFGLPKYVICVIYPEIC
jgi:uncharacterized protein with HEPN domain